jgi:hypothetical protein
MGLRMELALYEFASDLIKRIGIFGRAKFTWTEDFDGKKKGLFCCGGC